MTSTEMIKDMLERQKAYDAEVFKKHNVDYISKSQLESALFDELGELMHAQKSDWCWWKFTQEPKDEAKVFEEYIDVVHFALMYEIKFGSGCYQYEDIKWNYNKLKTDLGFGQAYAFSCVISLIYIRRCLMKALRKRNKLIKESTDVLIKLKISVPDVDNSDSCNVVDKLLNEIWNTAWSKEGVEVEDLKATYVKEKTTK
jgi:dimeric dUTPase (all-alpha-NTP-PPase superfamily)